MITIQLAQKFGSEIPLLIEDPTSGLVILNPHISKLQTSTDILHKVIDAAVLRNPIYLKQDDGLYFQLKTKSMDLGKEN